jgi:hypothetical protein
VTDAKKLERFPGRLAFEAPSTRFHEPDFRIKTE